MSDNCRFGVVLLTEHSRNGSAARYREEIHEQARLIESLGFDSLWISEHHFTDRIYFDNFQILSYLAAVTNTIRLGTAICLAPLYNPVVLAERTANIDVLSDGRFIFGTATGYREKEFEVAGVDRARRGARLNEALELIQALWQNDDVTFHGREFDFEDVSINPKPIQDEGPSIWIGGSAPRAVERAAVRGGAWMIDPRISIPKLRKPIDHYNATLAEADITPEARPIWREVFVGETTEDAIEIARPYLLEKYESYLNWGANDAVGDDSVDSQFDELTTDRFILGSPTVVRNEIERYRSEFDIDHFLLRTRWPGMPVETARKSLRRFAEEVMPAFN